MAGAKVLANNGSDGKCYRHGWHEDGLHDAATDTEAGLRSRTEILDHQINDTKVHKHQQHLAPCRQANVQHALPHGKIRSKLTLVKLHVFFLGQEVVHQNHNANGHRNRSGQTSAQHAQRPASAKAHNQDRRQYRVEYHRHHLHQHAGLDDAGGSQG